MITTARAVLAAFAIALTACGGGDPEMLPDGWTNTATGGRADVAAASLAVDLPGPTVTLEQPGEVVVEIELDWQQSLAAPATVSVAVELGGKLTTAQAAEPASTAATRFTSRHSLRLKLPAGQTTLAAQALAYATDGTGAPLAALTYFDLTARWQVSAAP